MPTSQKFDPRQYWHRVGQRRSSAQHQLEAYRRLDDPGDNRDDLYRRVHLEHLTASFRWYSWKTVLDAGCGPGFWFSLWDQLGVSATGVDFSAGSLDVAREVSGLLGTNFETVESNLSSLPFQDQQFDVASIIKVCLHIPPGDLPAVLAELARVAKFVAICDWMVDGRPQTKQHVFHHNFPALFDFLGLHVVRSARDYGGQRFFLLGPADSTPGSHFAQTQRTLLPPG